MNIQTGKGDIRVAIVGVGNCANSLVQGVVYYKDAPENQEIPGLMHAVVGSYHINNVKFVAAFDVDAKKVGLDLADAIWASENNTIKFADVAQTGVSVQRGVTHDGLGKYYRETITESDAPAVYIRKSHSGVVAALFVVAAPDVILYVAAVEEPQALGPHQDQPVLLSSISNKPWPLCVLVDVSSYAWPRVKIVIPI